MSPKKIVLVVMILLLSACGYHLRGAYKLPEGLKNVYVEGGSWPLRDYFKQVLKSSSAQLIDTRKGAGVVVKVYNEDFKRRVVSLSSRGKTNELELAYRLEYELANADNKLLMEKQPIEIRREYYNDQQFMIAKDNEESLIRNQMYEQAVHTIMNRARVVLEGADKK